MSYILGCIGDDFTGSTDLANTLVRQGMRVIQLCNIPPDDFPVPEADALIISLKCRSIEASEAVAQCKAALAWLQKRNCKQYFWKYCSTFDSTPKGNIGPVAQALLNQLGAKNTIVCPAFPENKRSIYKGYLFVADQLLNESSMRDHPVTPMRDASLVRLLEPQVTGKVGLVALDTVHKGPEAIATALDALAANGVQFAVTDAVEDQDLFTIGKACANMPLITGGSGIALGLPENYRAAGLLPQRENSAIFPEIMGKTAILSGSCSTATRAQLSQYRDYGLPMRQIDPLQLNKGPEHLNDILQWSEEHLANDTPVLVYASEESNKVAEVQALLGQEHSGQLVENALATLAKAYVKLGVRRFIVAGGESSGAVVQALDITGLQIGPQIAPGVPWTVSIGTPSLALALKSGNFGGKDFFADALRMIPRGQGEWI